MVAVGGRRTLTEIAARSDLPLSTVHRLATELAAWRVLAHDDEGRYRAGPPLWAADASSSASTAGGACAIGTLPVLVACSGSRPSHRDGAGSASGSPMVPMVSASWPSRIARWTSARVASRGRVHAYYSAEEW
jgi:IclR-like helix-turn-helix domain-containing protein